MGKYMKDKIIPIADEYDKKGPMAKKDAHNRERGLQRLRKRIQSGRLTKENLNRRGYNKFLKLTGEVTVEIDEPKIEQAAR